MKIVYLSMHRSQDKEEVISFYTKSKEFLPGLLKSLKRSYGGLGHHSDICQDWRAKSGRPA